MKKSILQYYQDAMSILSEANHEHGYGAAQGIVKMLDETISYNFRQELAEQIIRKEMQSIKPGHATEIKRGDFEHGDTLKKDSVK